MVTDDILPRLLPHEPSCPAPRSPFDKAHVLPYRLEPSLLDRQAQPVTANELVVGVPRLGVLTDHVHILEGALQEMALVNGGRTGSVVDGVNHLDRQPNCVRRGNAQRGTLVHTERAGGAYRVPDVTHRFRQGNPAK